MPELSKADVAQLVKGIKYVKVLDENGKQKRHEVTLVPLFEKEEYALTEKDIYSFRVKGEEVIAITNDGQRVRASLNQKAAKQSAADTAAKKPTAKAAQAKG